MEAQLPLPIPPITLHEAKENISVRHLEQLSELPLTKEPPPLDSKADFPDGVFGSSSPYEVLEQWSKDNATQIQKAVKDRAFGGPDGSPIQWINAFLGFMEAATVYLRDWNKVVEAAEAYKKNNFDEALKLLNESTADIEKIAALWRMKFLLLCDLVDGPGSWLWNGPYCGVFYSEDPDAPFAGVAFKGTNIRNWRDIVTDISTTTVQTGEVLYNTNVSKGVYNGMFMKFKPGRAIDLIRMGLNDLIPNIPNTGGKSVITHVAGHSLGGSYSNICFTQFTVPDTLPPLAVLGDLYTFGCPRIGYKDFASALKEHLGNKTGSAWRVANAGDLVPQVPPVWPGTHDSPFNHVDAGYRVSTSEAPVLLASEIGKLTSGPSIWPPPSVSPHFTTSYYESLQKAMSI